MTQLIKTKTSDEVFTRNTKFTVYTERQLDRIEPLQTLTPGRGLERRVVAKVLPFRDNKYVIEDLMEWTNVRADPIFRLTSPRRGMLGPEDYSRRGVGLKREEERSDSAASA